MIKKKVLIINTVGLKFDGITSVITSYLENMDISSLDISLVGTIIIENTIRKKIENLGCPVIDFPDRNKETLKYFVLLTDYIKREKIDVVHAHGNSGTLAIELLAAKLGGAKKRIAHSHNTKCNHEKADRMLRPLFDILYTDALACGIDAGKWLYGGNNFSVLKNGRKMDKYSFKLDVRQKMREKYGLNDELVVGHVGGFFEQKNHAFLINVFREVLKRNSKSRLFLIGEGPLRNEVYNSIEEIRDKVVFVGNTDRVEDYLNMMDIMLLPSLFEGLPLVVIEWQINGIPCIVSDVVSKECKILDSVYFRSINQAASEWAEDVCNIYNSYKRIECADECFSIMRESEFNIENSADSLKRLYEE